MALSIRDVIAPLFAPAHRPDRFAKAATSGADAVIIDLEDAVAPRDKEAARANIVGGIGNVPVMIRVNAIGTPWHDADVSAVLSLRPVAVVIPKAEDTSAFVHLVARIGPTVPVLALIETAQGLAGARAIAALENITRLAFGSWDFCADLGCEHTEAALLGARTEIVLASRLAGMAAPIDGITIAIDDSKQVEADARYARALGFGGKLVIHPGQVTPVMAGFAPSWKDIDWATRVLASGDAAVAVDGMMVDEPIRARARATLARARSGKGEREAM